MSDALCVAVAEALVEAIDGILPAELEAHVETCAACSDLVGEAERLGSAIAQAGDRYRHAQDFEARVLAALDPDGVEPTRPMRRFSAIP